MIPKVIHYCWFGHNPLPKSNKDYMLTWKKYCPDFQVVEWNEHNFNVSTNPYCEEAYEARKWAFVSDYARLKIIYEHGGIYFDTDVELIRSIETLICDGRGFIGFQNKWEITTGLGFAAEAHNPVVGEMLKMYESVNFKTSDSYDLTPCPVRNSVAMIYCGLKTGFDSKKVQLVNNIKVLPTDYLNPFDAEKGKLSITDNTYSIHHYTASWLSNRRKVQRIKSYIPAPIIHFRTNYISKTSVNKMLRNMERNKKSL